MRTVKLLKRELILLNFKVLENIALKMFHQALF